MAHESNGSMQPIRALNAALDERDTPTHDHCDRVCELAVELGVQVGLSEAELRQLRLAARLHDIGKIGIPDLVLKKPGRLNEAEWDIMKSHSSRSERLVLASSNLEHATEIAAAVRAHHERYDGLGYPDGLSREAIPVASRIIAIVDTYDAMARLRLYGSPVPHEKIMIELARVSGTQHDPYISEQFAKVIRNSAFRTE